MIFQHGHHRAQNVEYSYPNTWSPAFTLRVQPLAICLPGPRRLCQMQERSYPSHRTPAFQLPPPVKVLFLFLVAFDFNSPFGQEVPAGTLSCERP